MISFARDVMAMINGLVAAHERAAKLKELQGALNQARETGDTSALEKFFNGGSSGDTTGNSPSQS